MSVSLFGPRPETTLTVRCADTRHGIQHAPAPTVRIAQRHNPLGGTTYTFLAPCPVPGCPVVVLVPSGIHGRNLAWLLYAGGAEVINVTATTSTSELFPAPPSGGAA